MSMQKVSLVSSTAPHTEKAAANMASPVTEPTTSIKEAWRRSLHTARKNTCANPDSRQDRGDRAGKVPVPQSSSPVQTWQERDAESDEHGGESDESVNETTEDSDDRLSANATHESLPHPESHENLSRYTGNGVGLTSSANPHCSNPNSPADGSIRAFLPQEAVKGLSRESTNFRSPFNLSRSNAHHGAAGLRRDADPMNMSEENIETPSDSTAEVHGGHQSIGKNDPAIDDRLFQEECIISNLLNPPTSSLERSEVDSEVQAEKRINESGLPVADVSAYAAIQESSDIDAECDLLTNKLATAAGQDRMFELILPNGNTLGVFVETTATEARFVLTPQEAHFGKRIKQQQAHIERSLKERLGKKTRVSVVL